MSQVAVTLYTKNYLFDFATEYASKHTSLPAATTFKISDEEFNQFTKWLENKDYSYETETEQGLDSIKRMAVREKYYDDAKDQFDALKTKLSHDKKQDLLKHKDQVKHLLENEIASRYYYVRGRIAQGLQYDKELDKALALLTHPADYQAVLKPGK